MSASLNVCPIQWSNLLEIEDVEPLNDGDTQCLIEVRDILKKHGKRERFGVALLHKHFEMSGDEVLVETTDKQNRLLTIQPVPASQAGPTIETIWELGDGDDRRAFLGCRQQCSKDVQGNHNSFHIQT